MNPLPTNSRTPTPDPCPLPPSSRDFEIFEQNQIDFLSTRRVAEKHRLSQTRVRQIVTHVANWLAAHLPAKSDAEKEADVRLAQHLAAAQLRRQIEQCQNYFDGSGDPKYLRHQTRIIVALARLGVVPGAIDSLAADYTAADLSDRGADIPVCHTTTPSPSDERGAGLRPASDVGCISEAPCTTTLEAPETQASTVPLPLSPHPLPEACSPPQQQTLSEDWATAVKPAVTPDDFDVSGDLTLNPETTLQGLAIMERRLLTLLANTPADNHDRRSSLQQSLDSVRNSQASFELRLSPDNLGATIADPARTDVFAPAAVNSRI